MCQWPFCKLWELEAHWGQGCSAATYTTVHGHCSNFDKLSLGPYKAPESRKCKMWLKVTLNYPSWSVNFFHSLLGHYIESHPFSSRYIFKMKNPKQQPPPDQTIPLQSPLLAHLLSYLAFGILGPIYMLHLKALLTSESCLKL